MNQWNKRLRAQSAELRAQGRDLVAQSRSLRVMSKYCCSLASEQRALMRVPTSGSDNLPPGLLSAEAAGVDEDAS